MLPGCHGAIHAADVRAGAVVLPLPAPQDGVRSTAQHRATPGAQAAKPPPYHSTRPGTAAHSRRVYGQNDANALPTAHRVLGPLLTARSGQRTPPPAVDPVAVWRVA